MPHQYHYNKDYILYLLFCTIFSCVIIINYYYYYYYYYYY